MIDSPAVVVIGAGPAGLAAASALCRAGHRPVLVIDRDDAAGGLPRFCHHLGFGWGYAHRLENGPRFAARMIREAEAAGAVIKTRTTALKLEPGPLVHIVGPELGCRSLAPGAVVLATGIRETSRGPRLIPGTRPEIGLLTTGSLQQLVSRGVTLPWRRLVIAGTEHVSFSAILTARRAGIRTVAMVEPEKTVRSFAAAGLLARAAGVELHTHSRIAEIRGRESVEAVRIEGSKHETVIACDSVLFSGGWVPESALCTSSGVRLDSGSRGPVIDNLFRTSLKGVFATGNVLRGVESSGTAALEGREAGETAAAFLSGRMLGWQGTVDVQISEEFEYFVPQRFSAQAVGGIETVYFRVKQDQQRAKLMLMNASGGTVTHAVRHLKQGRSGCLPIDRLREIAVREGTSLKAYLG